MRRLALVTGAAQGLGRAIAERLAADGIALVIGDLQHDAAQRAADELSAAGSPASALPLDVADERSVAAAYAEIERRFGRLDILVNNAGVIGLQDGKRAAVAEMSLATWEQTLRVNLTGTFLMCRGAIPLMRRRRWGRIVNIASTSARGRTRISNSNYAASKTAMVGLARVLAAEVGADGITVNSVAPSRILTPMTLAAAGGDMSYFRSGAEQTAVGRIAEPADVANAVAFLCAEESGFVTGAIVDVNGGSFMA